MSGFLRTKSSRSIAALAGWVLVIFIGLTWSLASVVGWGPALLSVFGGIGAIVLLALIFWGIYVWVNRGEDG